MKLRGVNQSRYEPAVYPGTFCLSSAHLQGHPSQCRDSSCRSLMFTAYTDTANGKNCLPPQKGNVCVLLFLAGWIFQLSVLSFSSKPTKGKDTKISGCQAALEKCPFGSSAVRGLWGGGFAAHMLGTWMWTTGSSPEFLYSFGWRQCQQYENVSLRYCPWDSACRIPKFWAGLMKYRPSTTLCCENLVSG